MIHVLHHQTDDLVGWVDLVLEDTHSRSLNEETFDFIAPSDADGIDEIQGRSRILIPAEEGDYREFIVDKIYESRVSKQTEIYSIASYTDLQKSKVIAPAVQDGQTLESAAVFVLEGLEWQVGIVEYSGIRKWMIEKHLSAYEALHAIALLFDVELVFRVTTDGDKVTGRYVDFLKKQGMNRGKEITFGKDLIEIKRTIDPSRVVSALYCIGPEREDGTRLTVTVTNNEAFQNWNRKGQHLIEIYEPESNDQDMTLERLTQLGETELNKRIAAAVNYEVEGASLEHIFGYEHEVTRIGDTAKIKDESFEPEMYLDSRVIKIDRSIFDKSKKTYTLGEVIEYEKDDVMRMWKDLQSLYATRVVKSPSPPTGKPTIIWIKTGGPIDIPHSWDGSGWIPFSPLKAEDINAETPTGSQDKADHARDEANQYTNSQLENYVEIVTYNQDLSAIQNQIDGSITTWFYDYDPSMSNEPANMWSTDEEKNNHLGDLFYNTSSGYTYRFALNSSVYQWIRITDTDVTKALSDASKAQDTADSKRRVFVNQPSPPYEPGDIWTQGNNGDILSCLTAKQEGEPYAAADWVKAAKYTDDQRAINAENNAIDYTNGQVEQVEEAISQRELSIFRQNQEPSGGGFVVGQLWIRTTDLTFFRWTGSAWEQFTPSVSSVNGIDSRLSIAESNITELDNEVSLRVKQDDYDVDMNDLTSRMRSAESSITIHADQIQQRVEKNNVVSSINQTAEQVQIQAEKIALDGYVEAKHIKSLNGLNVNNNFIVDVNGNVTFKGNLEGATGTFNGKITSSDLILEPEEYHPLSGSSILFPSGWATQGGESYYINGNIALTSSEGVLSIEGRNGDGTELGYVHIQSPLWVNGYLDVNGSIESGNVYMDGANKIANDSSTLYIDGNGGVALTNKASGGANLSVTDNVYVNGGPVHTTNTARPAQYTVYGSNPAINRMRRTVNHNLGYTPSVIPVIRWQTGCVSVNNLNLVYIENPSSSSFDIVVAGNRNFTQSEYIFVDMIMMKP
ncbi:phage tail spike protein [Bacillus gobiensis]|uniref:phage tail spike protein n=1 Tax=Bacillus gobiensis TaxID=1441095 RepID=UPI003D257540